MAASSSCGVLSSLSDAASIPFSSVPKTASMRSPQSVVFIRGASEAQRTIGAKQGADAKVKVSRRDVMLTSLCSVGMMVVAKKCRAVEEVNEKDLREKVLEQIDNLQQVVNKSLGDAKEAVTTKAEEAISSLKFGDDKGAEKVRETKSSIVERVSKKTSWLKTEL